MRIGEAVVVLLVVFGAPLALGVWMGRRMLLRRQAAHRRLERKNMPWIEGEHQDGDWYHVYCQKPDQENIEIGAVHFQDDDFTDKLFDLRLKRWDRLQALNKKM